LIVQEAQGQIFDWNIDGSSVSSIYSAYSYLATSGGLSSSTFQYLPITTSTSPFNAI
jgi:hypothetical protein